MSITELTRNAVNVLPEGGLEAIEPYLNTKFASVLS